jgi:archaellum component FlaC
VPASAADYEKQFALLSELNQSLSKLNNAVNRIRRLKNQLAALGDRTKGQQSIASHIATVTEKLSDIEGVFVDIHRQSPRDALRNPAGLNDTLIDLINTVSISDTAPTAQAEAVSRGLMQTLAEEIQKLDALTQTEIAEINTIAANVPVPQVLG